MTVNMHAALKRWHSCVQCTGQVVQSMTNGNVRRMKGACVECMSRLMCRPCTSFYEASFQAMLHCSQVKHLISAPELADWMV